MGNTCSSRKKGRRTNRTHPPSTTKDVTTSKSNETTNASIKNNKSFKPPKKSSVVPVDTTNNPSPSTPTIDSTHERGNSPVNVEVSTLKNNKENSPHSFDSTPLPNLDHHISNGSNLGPESPATRLLNEHQRLKSLISSTQETDFEEEGKINWKELIGEMNDSNRPSHSTKSIESLAASTKYSTPSASTGASILEAANTIMTKSSAVDIVSQQQDDSEFDYDDFPVVNKSGKASGKDTFIQNVSVTFSFDLSAVKPASSNDNSVTYFLPLPLVTQTQRILHCHSFFPENPQVFEIDQNSYSTPRLKCIFPSSFRQSIKYSCDLEIQPSSNLHSGTFYLGRSTRVAICSTHNESIQDICKKQRFSSIPDVIDRASSIANFVTKIPYDMDLYDQLYYYLDTKFNQSMPVSNGFQTIFLLLCHASGLDILPSSTKQILSFFDGYIFRNLRDVVFVKICWPALLKIELLNKSRDNELEKFFL